MRTADSRDDERPWQDAEDRVAWRAQDARAWQRWVGMGFAEPVTTDTLVAMKGQTNPGILRPRLPRRIRNASTDAERALWQRLRMRQLDGCKFRRQHPFGDYIVDFACLERRLVIELDGGQHADSMEADAQRTACLEDAGFRVLRFWNNQVFEEMDGMLETILRALQEHATPSPTRPPP